MNLTLLTDTTANQEPISVADAKAYLLQTSSADDAMIQTLITAARLEAENEHGRELSSKAWKLVLDRFPLCGFAWPFQLWGGGAPYDRAYQFTASRDRIELLDPLVSVQSVTYKKSDGTAVTMVANTDYIVDTDRHPGIICPAFGTTWPTDELWPSSAVQISFTSGMTPVQCPATIKQGIQLLVSQWYEGRVPFEPIRFVAEIPFSVTSLFRNNKRWRF